jgi:predicted Zn finger-like uncharacterized protein
MMQRQISQTTACPACATTFKVGHEQLLVAHGWVRCGQCGEVFDASRRLVPVAAGEPAAPVLTEAPEAQEQRVDEHAVPLPAADDRVAGHAATQANENASSIATEDANAPVEPLASPDREGRQEPVFAADAFFAGAGNPPMQALATGLPGVDALHPSALPQQEAEPFAEIDFVKKARHAGFWVSPLVRRLLGMACLALLLALALQWAVQKKDVLAAQEPRLAPWLQAMCRPLGCTVRPLRRIESLVIENSSFSRTGPDVYRLRFTLKNTGDAALEIPALEVTLTDSQDQPLVRRVTLPAEFGAIAATVGPRSEVAGNLTLKVAAPGVPAAGQAGFLAVTGYRILAFYP